MKRAFVIMIVFMFALFLLNSLTLAEEAEKKADEKAKVETKVEFYKIVKESDREIGKEGENEELEICSSARMTKSSNSERKLRDYAD
jgi:hypothetical protein